MIFVLYKYRYTSYRLNNSIWETFDLTNINIHLIYKAFLLYIYIIKNYIIYYICIIYLYIYIFYSIVYNDFNWVLERIRKDRGKDGAESIGRSMFKRN